MTPVGRIFVAMSFVTAVAVADVSQILTNQQLAAVPIPLARYEKGQEMMSKAVKNSALVNLQWKFLDKTYENHVYATDPFGNKYKVSCLSFKATSGFYFKMSEPTFTLKETGLTITHKIDRITADGLKFKFQVGPCVEHSASYGMLLKDVRITWKAKPMLSFADGGCKLIFRQDPEDIYVTIGDYNIYNSPNELDKLMKDAIREALNLFLRQGYNQLINRELTKQVVSVCGGGKK
jgi:hypothetical protein